jgi:ribosomal protein S18 acetylase RimI-like enzyme
VNYRSHFSVLASRFVFKFGSAFGVQGSRFLVPVHPDTRTHLTIAGIGLNAFGQWMGQRWAEDLVSQMRCAASTTEAPDYAICWSDRKERRHVTFRLRMNCGCEEHDAITIVSAQPDDLERYLDLLEEVAAWLETRGIRQWPRGNFRGSADYYSQSITQQEVQLAFIGDELVGTLRVLLSEPIVWPEVAEEDAIYVYNLAVRRAWAELGLGRRLLDWAGARAASLGRKHVRLDCVMDNDFLRDYYTQAGFEERGEIEAQFPPPVGALRLRRYERRL